MLWAAQEREDGQETQKARKLFSRADMGMGVELARIDGKKLQKGQLMDTTEWMLTLAPCAGWAPLCEADVHTGSLCRLGFPV